MARGRMGDPVQEVEELAERIEYLIEEELPESALDKAPDFFEGVREKAAAICETVVTKQHATPKQVQAMRNMLEAVEAWNHED